MAGRQEYRKELTEKQWQRQVEELAATFGWKSYHTHDSRRSDAGFPDLVLVRERIIYAELKTDAKNSKPTIKQIEWGQALAQAGGDVFLWRPADIEMVAEVLRARKK